LYETILSRKEN